MGVNSLPKTVTRQRRDCDLNLSRSAPESSTLSTRLPSHPSLLYSSPRQLLDTVEARKLAYDGHTNEETRELPGERDNARNNARCTQARKTTHGLDGQHQVVDRTLRGRVNQNDRGQR